MKNNLKRLTIIDGNDIINVDVWQDEFNQWHYKAKYPKVGKSHFYSMVNYYDALFDEQHPYWADLFHKQSQGELDLSNYVQAQEDAYFDNFCQQNNI
jgi:hypothetical protein